MKQLMVARQFPTYHPRAGEPTHFVPKIWNSIGNNRAELFKYAEEYYKIAPWWPEADSYDMGELDPKGHTIRSGKRWKTGDKVQLKVWSDKPYRSKTITITPPLELTVYDFEIDQFMDVHINGEFYCSMGTVYWDNLAKNDGLTTSDMGNWFITKKFTGFSGQILCWNKEINYDL